MRCPYGLLPILVLMEVEFPVFFHSAPDGGEDLEAKTTPAGVYPVFPRSKMEKRKKIAIEERKSPFLSRQLSAHHPVPTLGTMPNFLLDLFFECCHNFSPHAGYAPVALPVWAVQSLF